MKYGAIKRLKKGHQFVGLFDEIEMAVRVVSDRKDPKFKHVDRGYAGVVVAVRDERDNLLGWVLCLKESFPSIRLI